MTFLPTFLATVLSRRRSLAVGESVGYDGHYGCVFSQLTRVDLVEGIGWGVVVVEVEAAVLVGAEAGHAFLSQATDVFADAARGGECFRADGMEDAREGLKPGAKLRLRAG